MQSKNAAIHAVLLGSLAVAVPLAACGGEGGQGPGPQTPSSKPSESTSPTSPTATVPTPSGSGTTSTAPPSLGNKPIVASAMATNLKELGLDPKSLPPLKKLEPDKLRKVMNTFTKALGTNCTGCHDPNDMKAPTPRKKVAARMWNDFTRALKAEDGSALYCDSCHQGKMEFLDRHDPKALGAWMDANMVSKLKRVDGKDHSCETCHGDPFEPKFLASWAK